MAHKSSIALQKVSRIRQCSALEEPYAYMRFEDIDVGEGCIAETRNRATVVKEFADFIAALSHRFEPLPRDGAQLTVMRVQPHIDDWIVFNSAIESQDIRFPHRVSRSGNLRAS